MGALKTGAKRNGGRTALFCFALLFALGALLLLPGAVRQEPLPAFVLDLPEDAAPLLLAETDGGLLLVTDGETPLCLLLDPADGRSLSRAELPVSPLLAFPGEEGLLLLSPGEDGLVLCLCRPETGEPISATTLPLAPETLLLLDRAGDGTVWAVSTASPDVLLRFSDGEPLPPLALPGQVSLLSAEDGLLVAGGEVLRVTEDGTAVLPALSPPAARLGPGLYLDENAAVIRLEGDELIPRFQLEAPVFGSLLGCPDRAGGLIVWVGGSGFSRYTAEGTPLDSWTVPGRPLALCPAGALLSTEDGPAYCPFPAEESPSPGETPAPTEEPAPVEPEPPAAPSHADPPETPAPDPQPTPPAEDSAPPTPTPPARVENGVLYLLPGTTADRLRTLLQPEAVDIRDQAGEPVLRGPLTTGMTANGWTVVVQGDLTGTGTVTRTDLRAALAVCLRPGGENDLYTLAADLDGSGGLDTADLLLLRAMLLGD